MSTNTQDPNFQAKCKALWDVMARFTSIDRFHENIRIHEKSVFLGYADVTIGVGQLFSWKVRGVSVKLLNGKAHLDMPTERGADGKYYPQTFPKSAETRTVLTTITFGDERVKQAMQNAANLAAQQPAQPQAAASAGVEVPAQVSAGVDAGLPQADAGVPNPFEAEGLVG